MRILLFTQALPYSADRGPKAKTDHVLNDLTQSHDVTLVSFGRDSDKPDDIRHLETLCERVITVSMVRSFIDALCLLAQGLVNSEPWMLPRNACNDYRQVCRALANV
jgi:hypothetical protein